jgi:hypothetical protein
MKFLCSPHYTLTNSHFLWRITSVDIRLIISIRQSLLAASDALDEIGYWVVQLFLRADIGRLLLLPLECGEGDTSHPITARAMPSTMGNHEEQHIQSIRNKEKVKTIF